MPRAEVLALAPADPADVTFQKLIDLLVEYGIHVESDARDRLPRTPPPDPTGYKAVIVDADAPAAREWEALLARRENAALRTRTLRYRKPDDFAWHNERPLWVWLNFLLLHCGVTPENRAFLDRNAARPDREVILGQAEACLREEPQWCRRWCDSTLVRLEGIWAAAEFYGRDDLRRAVLECVEDTLRAYADAPVHGKGERADGLFKHPIFPGLLLPLWKETGIARYRDAALGSMESPAEARRVAREWRTAAPLLQCESLDRKPWQWAMRAAWCNEPAFFQPAVDCMKAGYEALFDPRRLLWAHYGIRGRCRGLTWGRGQGWALYGLVGLLEHLPEAHPDRELLRSWLDRTAEGLRRAQDPESGLWHNVMGEPGTRREVSGTAKCVRHFSRAWRLGLCRSDFLPEMLGRAWRGLKARTFHHRSCTRCYGTGPGSDLSFYAALGAGGSYTACVQAGAEYVRAFGADAGGSPQRRTRRK
jgi:rhamnogalacturonyl hydrolase YesR